MTTKTQTSVILPDVTKSFAILVEHISEHGIEFQRVSEQQVKFTHEGCSLDFSHDEQELFLELLAPTENMLFFLKEAAAAHIMEIDPVAGENIIWAGAEITTNTDGTPVNFLELSLKKREEIFPGIIRLTLSSDGLQNFPKDGLHVKLMHPKNTTEHPVWPGVAPNGMTVWPKGEDELHVRYFTIRNVRVDAGEIDIDVVQHKGGMISDWAYSAAVGELIGIMGPGGGSVPDVAGNLLLAGDETALPAIARILEELPSGQKGKVVAAAPNLETLHSYLPSSNMEYHSLETASFRAECENFIEGLYTADIPPDYAWFGGEFSNANDIRKIFKEKFGLSKGKQLSVSYWEMGKRGAADVIE
ncbi:MAG: siderophore-interacting protein [Pseudomonadota bacterium]